MAKLAEIRNTLAKLPREERAELAAFLLEDLDALHDWVGDEEVARRSDELDSGVEKGLTQEEFLKACGRS